ncbi:MULTISPECIES: MIP/aquaporin family protein [unclassified Rothia (in: high G+C Gram-positive bacteria)]|uniref:MIP/aquaporin family protein n=1 Tax=unclassified Rothia (in: high G+C Gram-positive bacteria) TaxID=2689056 RepID=UPI00195EB672|nr:MULTISPECIES: MIP/aquaporin family protein [unclassified Rothia (in: high G+C Gram-positive bacteria)]MBM7050790.1 aquaporin family protein [Rothia sp. ZJ1223]QRZ60963.1 aquaporin family protein [Rothia sp. ZJ932]
MSLSASTLVAEGATALKTAEGTATTLGVFSSEVLGTAVLILLGAGVCAAVTLPKSAAKNTDWLTIGFGWAMAVFAAVYVSAPSGAHLNPAVTVGLFVAGNDFAPGIAPTVPNMFVYFAGEFLGAFVGAWLAYLAFKKHFDEAEPNTTRGVFSTAPAIRSYGWNLVTEAIGTFVLVGFVVASGLTPSGLGPLGVALIVLAIGLSLGTPTGYAINPARDLAPRIAHALMPIKGKGSSDWAYAWVPVVGPIIGATAAALIIPTMLGI